MGNRIQIKLIDFSQTECYDGTQIHPLWALGKFGLSGNCIVIFRGSMKIPLEEMIDIKDIVREKDLAEFLISGDDCIHFIIELFDDQPANLKIAYHRLHLLALIIHRILEEQLEVKVDKRGTDLFIRGEKINVAIATSTNNSTKIHFGINIVSSGVPDYVKAIGLTEIKKDLDLEKLAITIAELFKTELEEINNDVVKSKTL